MKKVVLVSDSHNYNSRLDYVLQQENDADYYLHCGDICEDKRMYPEFITVKGNNDYDDYEEEIILQIEDVKIMMLHSHNFYYHNKLEKMIEKAKDNNINILCYGHTHTLDDSVHEGIQFLNPGSLYYNRDENKVSYVVIHIDKDKFTYEFKAL